MKTKILTFLIALITAISFTAGSAFAKSACQGLSNSACKRSGCVWVKSYKRKGKAVNAYCRTKGKRGKRGKRVKAAKLTKKRKSAKRTIKRKVIKRKAATKKRKYKKRKYKKRTTR